MYVHTMYVWRHIVQIHSFKIKLYKCFFVSLSTVCSTKICRIRKISRKLLLFYFLFTFNCLYLFALTKPTKPKFLYCSIFYLRINQCFATYSMQIWMNSYRRTIYLMACLALIWDTQVVWATDQIRWGMQLD